MQLPGLATQLLGSPSNFRELSKLLNITPFDPSAKLDRLMEIKSVQELTKSAGELEKATNQLFKSVQKVADDPVVMDWLMN